VLGDANDLKKRLAEGFKVVLVAGSAGRVQ